MHRRPAGEACCRGSRHLGAAPRDEAAHRVLAEAPAGAGSDVLQAAPKRTDCCPPAVIAERREHRAWVQPALDAVRERTVDAGLIIHEAQLTYSRTGFHRVVDLGRWWKGKYNLPLPLGCNVLLRSLSSEVKSECCRMMRESIQYALDNHDEALSYALQFARDMDPQLAQKFVGMYVNHHTLDCGEDVPVAAQKLVDLGYEAGIVSKRVQFEFVR